MASSHLQAPGGFGPHLVLDCRKVNKEKCSSVEFVSKFLAELPGLVGMTAIIPPYVFHYQGLVPEDEGVTGMIIIAESHITFHSFIHKDYFFFDCFSCKTFDVEFVKRHVIESFGVQEVEDQCFERGRYFPRQAEAA